MSTNMGFMTREIRTTQRSVASLFIKLDMSSTSAGFDSDGILRGSTHVDVAEDAAGVASIRLKNPGQNFVGVSVIADGTHTPVYTMVTDGQEIDIEGLVATEVFIRLDVSYAPDET